MAFRAMFMVSRTIDYPCRETGVLALCCTSTAFGVREAMANAAFRVKNPTDIRLTLKGILDPN